jgi:hypothetical protein
MFNHSYAAATLADQHRRDLQADAARSRLARQATNTKPARLRASAHADPNHSWSFWLARRRRDQATANST